MPLHQVQWAFPASGHCMRLNLKDFPLPLHQRPPTMPGALFFLLVPNHMTIELLNWEQTIEKMTGSQSGNLGGSFVFILPSFLFCQHVRASAVATKNGGRNYDISLARSLMMEVVSCRLLKNFG